MYPEFRAAPYPCFKCFIAEPVVRWLLECVFLLMSQPCDRSVVRISYHLIISVTCYVPVISIVLVKEDWFLIELSST
jgi:hypothetical protein